MSKYTLIFKRKANQKTMSMIPQTVIDGELDSPLGLWDSFLRQVMRNKKIKVTLEWEESDDV